VSDTPKWYQIISQDPRWPQRDDTLWIEDLENIFIARRRIDLDQGRALLAETALCAYEWLQTDKGLKKKSRGMRTFWVNWLKGEGDRAATNGQRMGQPAGTGKATETRERRQRDTADLQRRIAAHAAPQKTPAKSHARAKG